MLNIVSDIKRLAFERASETLTLSSQSIFVEMFHKDARNIIRCNRPRKNTSASEDGRRWNENINAAPALCIFDVNFALDSTLHKTTATDVNP